jgi:hypothetical protein
MVSVKKLIEGQHTWEFMVAEPDEYGGRDTIVLDINQTVVPGTVLAQKGAVVGIVLPAAAAIWGAWVSGDANYGVACGVAGYAVTTTATQGKTVALVRGNAQVRLTDLQWADAPTAPQQATALAQLEARLITAR